jgi:hypothetical protein
MLRAEHGQGGSHRPGEVGEGEPGPSPPSRHHAADRHGEEALAEGRDALREARHGGTSDAGRQQDPDGDAGHGAEPAEHLATGQHRQRAQLQAIVVSVAQPRTVPANALFTALGAP